MASGFDDGLQAVSCPLRSVFLLWVSVCYPPSLYFCSVLYCLSCTRCFCFSFPATVRCLEAFACVAFFMFLQHSSSSIFLCGPSCPLWAEGIVRAPMFSCISLLCFCPAGSPSFGPFPRWPLPPCLLVFRFCHLVGISPPINSLCRPFRSGPFLPFLFCFCSSGFAPVPLFRHAVLPFFSLFSFSALFCLLPLVPLFSPFLP